VYPTSTAYKVAIKRNVRDVKITGTITLKDDTVINITDEDIVLGSLYFTEQCVAGEDIEIGNVYASELGLSLTSPPENPYSLDGARIIVNFGIDVSEDGSGVYEYVPLGYFYVTEIERKHTAVSLKALDGMILFDIDLSGVLTTGTPYSLIQSCCTKAGVVLATSSSAFENFANGLTAFTIPEDSKIKTCRDLIMWVCQLLGAFARMNRLGQLEIIPITGRAPVKTISKDERFVSDVSDFYVKISKVSMKVGETEYSQGTAGMTLTLEENPLLAGKSEAEINAALAEILAQVTEAEYTPYNLTCAGDPALQAGDWVKLTGVSNINGPEFVYTRNSVAYHPETGEEIPEDTPVFVDFAAGKKGSLMVEGVTNLLTVNQSSFETGTSGWSGNRTDRTRINTVAWHGSWSLKCTPIGEGKTRGVYSTAIPVTAGESYTAQCRAMQLSGGTVKLRLVFEWWGAPTASTSYGESVTLDDTWQEIKIENKVAPEGATRVVICIYTENIVSASEEWVIDGIQLIQSSYPLPWHIGGSTRAAPLKRITLPEPLPEEFGVGIAAKMLHAHDAADRTFWECGGYRCYFDSSDNKLKMTNGVVTAETATVTWGANDYVGVYAGRENGNLFLQAKIAGALTDRVEAEAGAGAGTGETLYVGSRADGSESVNAVVADMVFHDRPEDIDPMGYLSAIPGGGE